MHSSLQQQLITWYNNTKRDFPWRQTQDPYHIWISEIMLQQTTTEAVIPYYNRFLENFPTIFDLAQAKEEDVYKAWEGLGYYRRAKHLHLTAQYIVEHYQGVFPKTYDEVLALKGIGPYTAGAICSIAYHLPVPAVDGNVLRIMARVNNLHENIATTKTQKIITQHVQDLLEHYNPSSLNQGFMDLGARICRPKNPKCDECPIVSHCQAYHLHQQNVLPIHIKNINHKDIHYITGIITYEDRIYIKQNPAGLLENLYGFIQYDVESPYSFIESFENDFHTSLEVVSFIKDIKHVFTHRTWYMHVYHFVLSEPIDDLYTFNQIQELPLSTAHLKVLKAFLQNK